VQATIVPQVAAGVAAMISADRLGQGYGSEVPA
jgi:hypothetical protein